MNSRPDSTRASEAAESGRNRRQERQSAWWKAQELLARRAHATRELELKLVKRGFPASEIAAVLARLTERGLLDDEAFAEALTAELFQRRGYGYYAILPRLRRKGLSPELCRRVLQDYFAGLSPEELEAGLKKVLARRRRRAEEDPVKLYAWLKNRGFRSDEIRRTLELDLDQTALAADFADNPFNPEPEVLDEEI
jgi:regulatory protein